MAEETKSPLQALVEPLEELEYFADYQPAGGDSVMEKLYLSLNVDEGHPEREYGLEIFFINDVTEAFGDEEEEEDAIVSQFMLILPFRIPVEAYLNVMRYCNLINRMLPVGAFGLAEEDAAVYLRYCLTTESRTISQTVLLEVVSALEFACKEYAPQFEAFCKGEKSFDDIVAQVEESGLQIPSVGNPDLFVVG